jgi:hypothetical protein
LTKTRPTVLLAASKWWPLSARLAGALNRHGCDVAALCPPHHPLRYVSGVRRFYRYGGLDSLGDLKRSLHDAQPDIVVPCDDGVVAQLHALHAQDPELKTLIEHSLGAPEGYAIVGSRHALLDLAKDLGICVPRTGRVAHAADLEAWYAAADAAAVLKVDGETGGNGVRICSSLVQAQEALRKFQAPPRLATALKRLLVNRDALALWMRARETRDLTVQAFVPGRPANSMLACWRGELLSIVSVAVVAAEGATGAATVVRLIRDERMRSAAQLIAARLKLSGFYGLDFILEADSGIPHLIELNPRCTQLGHIEFAGTGSLAGAFASMLTGAPRVPAQNPVRSETIALFPQALAAGEMCRSYLEAGHHDIPTDAPELVRQLMRESWPQRHWPSRLYHAFNPIERPQAALFEPCAARVPDPTPADLRPELGRAALKIG